MSKINELLPLHNVQYEQNTDLSRPYCIEYPYWSAVSRPIRVLNTIQTRTISFHIVHNTV
jgi:carbonic anhydrase